MSTSLYVLVDSHEPSRVRYVGISIAPLSRMKMHCEAPSISTLVGEWILGLKWRERRLPEMRVVGEFANREEAKAAERRLIASLQEQGQADLNMLLVSKEVG
ncbi:MAG: hypothetical protein C0503_09535 [Gemmatimonas sp.]|nr:hypothetical protein [Gemmatimonas sp.]